MRYQHIIIDHLYTNWHVIK